MFYISFFFLLLSPLIYPQLVLPILMLSSRSFHILKLALLILLSTVSYFCSGSTVHFIHFQPFFSHLHHISLFCFTCCTKIIIRKSSISCLKSLSLDTSGTVLCYFLFWRLIHCCCYILHSPFASQEPQNIVEHLEKVT